MQYAEMRWLEVALYVTVVPWLFQSFDSSQHNQLLEGGHLKGMRQWPQMAQTAQIAHRDQIRVCDFSCQCVLYHFFIELHSSLTFVSMGPSDDLMIDCHGATCESEAVINPHIGFIPSVRRTQPVGHPVACNYCVFSTKPRWTSASVKNVLYILYYLMKVCLSWCWCSCIITHDTRTKFGFISPLAIPIR